MDSAFALTIKLHQFMELKGAYIVVIILFFPRLNVIQQKLFVEVATDFFDSATAKLESCSRFIGSLESHPTLVELFNPWFRFNVFICGDVPNL